MDVGELVLDGIRSIFGGAEDLCTVAHAEAGVAAILHGVGVIIGGKTRRLNDAANLQILDGLGGGDVTVDKHAGDSAGGVLHIDGFHKIVGHGNGSNAALDRNQLTFRRAVIELGSRDEDRLDRLGLAYLLNFAHLQLRLALIGIRSAGNAHDVTDLEIGCHGEAVDAAGCILHINAVKECCILVIAGGIGGHDAFDGELEALLCLCAHIRDGVDPHGTDGVEQILTKRVIVVFRRDLHIVVIHEGGTGNEDQALALDLLGCHDQQTVVFGCISILGHRIAAEAVAVRILGNGGAVGKQNRRNGGGQHADRIAVFVHGVNARAAVVTDAAG